MNRQWQKIYENLQKTLAPGIIKVWVDPLRVHMQEQTLTLEAPNDFVADWVKNRLLDSIRQVTLAACGQGWTVDVLAAHKVHHIANVCKTEAFQANAHIAIPPATENSASELSASGLSATDQPGSVLHTAKSHATGTARRVTLEQGFLPLRAASAPVQWRHSFDDFVVGPCNDLAHAAALNVSRLTKNVSTLFISSGPGLGKTHLTQAVGKALCNASNTTPRVEYLTAEHFASCFVQAMKSRTIDAFKSRFRDVDVLLLEDVHFLQNKEKMQDEVLSTIKTLHDNGSRVVLTSSFAPNELANVDERLVSRFCSGFLAHMQKPDKATRKLMLQEKARQQNVPLHDDIVDLLADRLCGDVRQMESCLHNVFLRASLLDCPVHADMVLEIMAQYNLESPFLTIESITRKVCEAFALKADQIATKSRKTDHVMARNTIFYLSRRYTDLSLANIGEHFGRRHSTVLKGIATVERELTRNTHLGRQIATTLERIERQQSSTKK